MIQEKLRLLQKQMELKLQDIRISYQHRGIKGEKVEQLLRDFLREYLPPYNRVGSGEVIDSHGLVSSQTDVVITNEHHPYINDLKSSGLYFIEGVACAGEVKSVFTSDDFQKVMDSCRRFKSLKPQITPGTQFIANPSDAKRFVYSRPYFLFAFESQLSFEEVFQRVRKHYNDNDTNITEQIDALFFLDKGRIINVGDGEGSLKVFSKSNQPVAGFAPIAKHYDDNILPNLLFWLSTSIISFRVPASIIIPYVFSETQDSCGTNS